MEALAVKGVRYFCDDQPTRVPLCTFSHFWSSEVSSCSTISFWASAPMIAPCNEGVCRTFNEEAVTLSCGIVVNFLRLFLCCFSQGTWGIGERVGSVCPARPDAVNA